MKRRRFHAAAACGALAALTALAGRATAQAPAWPTKPVKLLLSQPPGSGPDNVARVLAERLQRAWGQPVVIDNRPGGQNVIGAQAAARAEADGHTLYFATTAALVSNAYLFKTLPYDPQRDFVPVAFVARSPFGVLVEAASPIASVADLIARAKAAPGTLSMANEGPRTLGGMIARLLDSRAGMQCNAIAYPSVAVALQNLIGGHAQVAVADLASSAALVRQGRLRLLAVTSAQRAPGWGSTPALAETLPGFDMSGWFAVVAPAGTPAAAIARANRGIAEALADREVSERIHAIGPRTDAAGGPPEQLAQFFADEHKRWALMARDIGLLPE